LPAVCNSSPLMWLSKAGRLALLKHLYGRVIIPEEVYRETVEKGLAEGFTEALVVKEAVEEGWAEVSALAEADRELCRRTVEHAPEIHTGEAQAIMIARKTGLPLLMDEASGRSLAETFGLKVNGTAYVIFKGLEEGCLKREETIETVLRLVEKGFRIEPGLLSRILRAIETGRG
jgi:predicted nucleic acid-binding protein